MSEKITAGSGERAKALFSWWKSKHPHEKKTQAALAESMGILPEVLNAKLNGKRTLTTKDAKKIADFFPGVRFEYIMGFDNAITEDELLSEYVNKKQNMAQRKTSCFITLAELSGFEVVFAGTDCLVASGNSIKTEDYYILRRGALEQRVYFSQITEFVEELSDYLNVRLDRFLKKNGGLENG